MDYLQIEQQQQRIRKAVERGLFQEGFRPCDIISGDNCRLTLQISGTVSEGDASSFSIPPMVWQGWIYQPQHHADDGEVLQLGDLEILQKERLLRIKGELISLTRKENDLLTYLVCHQDTILSREELLTVVWGEQYRGDVRTVDGHIKRLRRKLGEYRWCLQTVRNAGYRFVWDESLPHSQITQ